MQTAFLVLLICWYIGCAFFFIYLYLLHSKPYEATFRESLYTTIPSFLEPAELSFLLYHKIVPETLAATIIYLIDQQVLLVKKEQDYIIALNPDYHGKLSQGYSYAIDILMDIMGDGKQVHLSEIYHFCEDKRNNSVFLLNYQLWGKIISKEANAHQFFEPKWNYSKVQFYKYFGFGLFILNILLSYHFLLGYFMIIPAYLLSHYFYKIYKRTVEANEEYVKWMAFRNHLMHIKGFEVERKDIRKYMMYGILLKVKNVEKDLLNTQGDGFMTTLVNSLNRCIVRSYFHGDRGVRKTSK